MTAPAANSAASSLAARILWARELWRDIRKTFALVREASTLAQSSHPQRSFGDSMTTISIAQLKSLGSILGGANVKTAITELTAGKADGVLLGAEDVADAVGVFLPPAAVVAEGIGAARILLPYFQKFAIRGDALDLAEQKASGSSNPSI